MGITRVSDHSSATEVTFDELYVDRFDVDAESGTVNTTSLSPGANKLLICFSPQAGDGGPPNESTDEPTGLGLTWTEQTNDYYASRRRLFVWTAWTGSSAPTPGAVTVSYDRPGSTVMDLSVHVIECSGVDESVPMGTWATDAVSSDPAISVTIIGSLTDGDKTFAAAGLEADYTPVSFSVGTLLSVYEYVSGANFRQSGVGVGTDMTPEFTWGTQDQDDGAGIAGAIIKKADNAAADAQEKNDNTGFSNSTDWVTIDSNTVSGSRWNGGFHFTMAIPVGAKIESAWAKFTAHTSPDINVDVYCEDVDDAADFQATQDVTDRTTTTASVEWVDDLSSVAAGTIINSPDITACVQEVVDRGGWANNNSMVVLLKGKSDTNTTARLFSQAASLYVLYSVPGTDAVPRGFHLGQ